MFNLLTDQELFALLKDEALELIETDAKDIEGAIMFCVAIVMLVAGILALCGHLDPMVAKHWSSLGG
jgi:hypothetical protein